MSKRFRAHIRSNVVGYVAVFIALSGTASAVDGPNPGNNTVGSEDIINGEVKTADIGGSTVTAGKVLDESLGNVDLKAGSVRASEVANGSLTGAEIDDNALMGSDVNESSLGQVPNAYAGGAVFESSPNGCSPTDSTFVPCGAAYVNFIYESKPLLIATGTVISGGQANQRAVCRLTENGEAIASQTIFLPHTGDVEEFTLIEQVNFFATGMLTFNLECNSDGGGSVTVYRSEINVITTAE